MHQSHSTCLSFLQGGNEGADAIFFRLITFSVFKTMLESDLTLRIAKKNNFDAKVGTCFYEEIIKIQMKVFTGLKIHMALIKKWSKS
jgi:hypothetical protein